MSFVIVDADCVSYYTVFTKHLITLLAEQQKYNSQSLV